MFNNFFRFLIVWGLTVLKSRGQDVSMYENNNIPLDIMHERELISKQTNISIKRAEIISLQFNLLSSIEPLYFQALTQNNNEWRKSTGALVWFKGIGEVNKLIGEHEELVREFEEAYHRTNTKQGDINN